MSSISNTGGDSDKQRSPRGHDSWEARFVALQRAGFLHEEGSSSPVSLVSFS